MIRERIASDDTCAFRFAGGLLMHLHDNGLTPAAMSYLLIATAHVYSIYRRKVRT